jgi:hypothetical protein
MRLQPLFNAFLGCAVALLLAATIPARAQEPVYPPGSRIGLVPPKGFTASPAFRGYVDMENKAIIVLFELPPAAFTEIEGANSIEDVKKQGLLVDKREEFAVPGVKKAILFTGRDEAGGTKSQKWLMFAQATDFTAAVNIQIPETAKDIYPEEAIRAALATLVARATPLAEQLGMLPFKVDDYAGFQAVEVAENRTLVLADDPKDGGEAVKSAHMIIGAAASPTIAAGDRANFSREEMKVTFAEPIRLGGQQGFEMRVDAKHVKSGADVAIVQWIRFGTGGVLRIVGVAPKEKWADAFPRFRQVRDSVNPR